MSVAFNVPYPDHVIDCVHVAVAGVHPDCPQREAKLLPRAVDNDGLPWVCGAEGRVSAGGRVSGGRVRGEGVRRQRAGEWRGPEDIWRNKQPPTERLLLFNQSDLHQAWSRYWSWRCEANGIFSPSNKDLLPPQA